MLLIVLFVCADVSFALQLETVPVLAFDASDHAYFAQYGTDMDVILIHVLFSRFLTFSMMCVFLRRTLKRGGTALISKQPRSD